MDEIAYYYPVGHEAHDSPQHAEHPARVHAIQSGLENISCWAPFPKLEPVEIPEKVLTNIHNPAYLKKLLSACERGAWYDMDTYLTQQSWGIAHRTAGGALATARAVWNRHVKSGFALCRPPGHHATAHQAMGFCLLNNIALAAEDLISTFGAERLAIIDLDLHHGNGTQDIFWHRQNVFYISTHQSPLYPGTGALRDTGGNGGEGYTMNIPLPPGSGNEAFASVMDELILPSLGRYNPEMLLISAGFDPHWRDPLGYLQLSARGYGYLIGKLNDWAGKNCLGRIALFLEGGYDLPALRACGQACVSKLLGMECQDSLGESPYQETDRWKQVLLAAKTIWQV
jgi:acetoin utilization deacetylase AcuC-like enzyme